MPPSSETASCSRTTGTLETNTHVENTRDRSIDASHTNAAHFFNTDHVVSFHCSHRLRTIQMDLMDKQADRLDVIQLFMLHVALLFDSSIIIAQ
jgi:hypothetical protein